MTKTYDSLGDEDLKRLAVLPQGSALRAVIRQAIDEQDARLLDQLHAVGRFALHAGNMSERSLHRDLSVMAEIPPNQDALGHVLHRPGAQLVTYTLHAPHYGPTRNGRMEGSEPIVHCTAEVAAVLHQIGTDTLEQLRRLMNDQLVAGDPAFHDARDGVLLLWQSIASALGDVALLDESLSGVFSGRYLHRTNSLPCKHGFDGDKADRLELAPHGWALLCGQVEALQAWRSHDPQAFAANVGRYRIRDSVDGEWSQAKAMDVLDIFDKAPPRTLRFLFADEPLRSTDEFSDWVKDTLMRKSVNGDWPQAIEPMMEYDVYAMHSEKAVQQAGIYAIEPLIKRFADQLELDEYDTVRRDNQKVDAILPAHTVRRLTNVRLSNVGAEVVDQCLLTTLQIMQERGKLERLLNATIKSGDGLVHRMITASCHRSLHWLLENGLDPQRVEDGKSLTDIAREQSDRTAAGILQSVIARRAAAAAVREMDLSPP